MLADLHARGVHGGHPDLHPDDPLLLQCREQAPCRVVPGPAVEPLVDGDPLAVALRQVPPRGSRAAHPQQGIGERVVVEIRGCGRFLGDRTEGFSYVRS